MHRTPIKISNIERVPSWKDKGAFDIKVGRWSQISPQKLDFTFEKPTETDAKAIDVAIEDIEGLSEHDKVKYPLVHKPRHFLIYVHQ